MLNKKLTLHDLESIDPTMYNSLQWIQYGLKKNSQIFLLFNLDLIKNTQITK